VAWTGEARYRTKTKVAIHFSDLHGDEPEADGEAALAKTKIDEGSGQPGMEKGTNSHNWHQ